jgi:CRISPR/Cas system-associated exonuclease Cas4 (RecB family)
MKYYISEVLGYRDFAGKAATLGTCLHKIMECLALAKLHYQNTGEKQFFLRLMDGETIIGQYEFNTTTWIKATKGKLDGKDVWIDGKMVLDDIFSLVYTYYANKYAEQNWTDEDKVKILEWVYTCVLENDGLYDPRKRKVIQPEQYVSLKMTEDWAKFDYGEGVVGHFKLNGIMDVIYEIDKNHYEVVDYKTGKRKCWNTGVVKGLKELEHDIQLESYYLMMNEIYPDIEHFTLTIFYIADGGPFKPYFYQERLPEIKDKIKSYFQRIQQIEHPKMLSSQQKHWKCQKLCPYFKRAHGDTNLCMAVHNSIKAVGIEKTTQEMRQK